LVNRFGEARSEARRANVGAPKGGEREWCSWGGGSQPQQLGSLGERCKLSQRGPGRPGGAPAAKGFSRILNTQDALQDSKTMDYGNFTFLAS